MQVNRGEDSMAQRTELRSGGMWELRARLIVSLE